MPSAKLVDFLGQTDLTPTNKLCYELFHCNLQAAASLFETRNDVMSLRSSVEGRSLCLSSTNTLESRICESPQGPVAAQDTWPEHAPELQKILKEAENYEARGMQMCRLRITFECHRVISMIVIVDASLSLAAAHCCSENSWSESTVASLHEPRTSVLKSHMTQESSHIQSSVTGISAAWEAIHGRGNAVGVRSPSGPLSARWSLLAASSLLPAAAQLGKPLGNISIDRLSGHFVDDHGRVRIFHGVNAVLKGYPWLPKTETFTAEDSLDAKTLDLLQEWGFNVVRLGVMWPGVEPEPEKLDHGASDVPRQFHTLVLRTKSDMK